MATHGLDLLAPTRQQPVRTRVRRSFRWLKLLFGLGVLLPLAAWGGVVGWQSASVSSRQSLFTHTVQPINLRIAVTATGDLASASSVNVSSEVEGQVAVISLLPRGTRVKEGEVVVELDTSVFKTRRTEQQIVVEQTRAAYSQAKQAFQLAESQAESDIRAAELAVSFAELDLRKYLEGDYPQQLRIAQSETTLAEEELKRAKERIQYSEELQKLGYLSEGQVDADTLSVLRYQIKVELAHEAVRLLRDYTRVRTKHELESQVEETKRALARVTNLAQGTINQAQAALKAQESTLSLEEEKLQQINHMIEKCIMRAPQDGVLLYPIPEDEKQEDLYIKLGTMVRERQHVFSIPDTDVLEVGVSIHEALVKKVKPGRKARIWVDAFPDLELSGKVKEVSDLPDPQSWRKSTVKFYECTLTLESQTEDILPGMNAKAEIVIKELKEVLAIPLQSVVRIEDTDHCYVTGEGAHPELRELELGKANDQYVEVKEGLKAGEQVVLSPDELEIPSNLAAADARQS